VESGPACPYNSAAGEPAEGWDVSKATIVEDLDRLPAEARGCVLTIGNFDGVHLGHRRILQVARSAADAVGAKVVAMLFDPPPLAVLAPDRAPPPITPTAMKVRRLAECGADVIVVVPATGEFLGIEARSFVQDVLVGRFRPRRLVEGPDFAFGRGRGGNVQTLRELGAEAGFEVTVVDPAVVELPGEGPVRVSSSLIRRLVLAGDVVAAGRCLGRTFSLYGRVVQGQGRGRLLEFPTANVDPGGMLVPGDGVYAARAEVAGRSCPAAVSIGVKPTFGPGPRTIEAHLIDDRRRLYDQPIALSFFQRLRDQETFPDTGSLRAQIAKDVERVRHLCRQ